MADVPYSWLSQHYDRLMGHVAYEIWANSISKILKRTKRTPRRLLELGAGTCKLAEMLTVPSLEFRVHTDLSLGMLQVAPSPYPFPRVACDATAIPFAAGFDFVLMCYDAVNYLDPDGIKKLFSEVERVLTEDGLFLFDITTEENSIQWFEEYVDAFEASGGMLVRRSQFDAANGIQHNFFDFFVPVAGGLYERKQEHHEQFIYPVPTLCTWLAESGLRVIDLLDSQTLRAATSKSERIQVLVERDV
jgi:SAM-dependent methyltransferase